MCEGKECSFLRMSKESKVVKDDVLGGGICEWWDGQGISDQVMKTACLLGGM